MSAFGGPNIITDGLVLSLDAGNIKSYPGSGTTWYDKSGNGNNGTLTNGPTFATGSIVFDGVDDYVSGNNLSIPLRNHSLSIWFKATGIPSNNDSAGGGLFYQSSDLQHGLTIVYSWLNQSVIFACKVNDGLQSSSGTVSRNTIHNVTGTYNGSTQNIYLDGLSLTQRAYAQDLTVTNPSYNIGRWGYPGYPRVFNGNIYNLQLYNRALSAEEVQQNYNATKSRFGL